MKRYSICLFLFLGASIACFAAGLELTRRQQREEESMSAAEASLAALEVSLAEAADDLPAANKEKVSHEYEAYEEETQETAREEKEYYLVCEDGFLLVFLKDRKTICLYTHIPITDFPASEQEEIREGIWFSDMMEVINYLESFTS